MCEVKRHPDQLTVRVAVVGCVKDALVPVTVIVNIPGVAGRLALIVMFFSNTWCIATPPWKLLAHYAMRWGRGVRKGSGEMGR